MLSRKLTIGFIASLPAGYYEVHDDRGCSVCRSLVRDKKENKTLIETIPGENTNWVSYRKISLHEYITRR